MDRCNGRPQVVIETPEFIKQASQCMTDKVRTEFINFIAANPERGDIIQGTGGARKIRWACHSDSGKRGGVRVVYYFYHRNHPILLFTVYPKNQRGNLSKSERNVLHNIIKQIVKQFKGKDDE